MARSVSPDGLRRRCATGRGVHVAHLLVGQPLRVTAKSKQVVAWGVAAKGVKIPRRLAHLRTAAAPKRNLREDEAARGGWSMRPRGHA
eukprot:8606654-Pyramimonas_sp.AAC.2